MTAIWALAQVHSIRRGVDVVAADAVEGRFPPLAFKPAVIATVVIQPEPEEEQAHERAEDDRAGGEIEHAPSKRSLAGAVKSQSNHPIHSDFTEGNEGNEGPGNNCDSLFPLLPFVKTRNGRLVGINPTAACLARRSRNQTQVPVF